MRAAWFHYHAGATTIFTYHLQLHVVQSNFYLHIDNSLQTKLVLLRNAICDMAGSA